jgi:dolichyl-phosphate beta-glucosyltransferase
VLIGFAAPLMELSVVIPVYNGASFIAERLRLLSGFLETTGLDYELIAVDDGSADASPTILSGLSLPRFRALVGLGHHGKFGALKRGMAATSGRCALFTDADVPYELAAIPYFTRAVLDGGFHLVVGDRTLLGSSYAERMPFVRRIGTRAFTFLLRILFTGGLHDTQCGLKAFRGDVARALFPLLVEEGFAGDVEALYVALKYNLAIRRAPVRLGFQGPSTVSAVKHGLGMLAAIGRVKRRYERGAYVSPALAEIARQDYWAAGDRPKP